MLSLRRVCKFCSRLSPVSSVRCRERPGAGSRDVLEGTNGVLREAESTDGRAHHARQQDGENVDLMRCFEKTRDRINRNVVRKYELSLAVNEELVVQS